LRSADGRYNSFMTTLSMMVLFTCLGAWWGWKVASVRLLTGTEPRWKRRATVERRVHARRVRYRRQLWRLGYTGLWAAGGAFVGFWMPWIIATLGGFLTGDI
jgi:hypothetical protein